MLATWFFWKSAHCSVMSTKIFEALSFFYLRNCNDFLCQNSSKHWSKNDLNQLIINYYQFTPTWFGNGHVGNSFEFIEINLSITIGINSIKEFSDCFIGRNIFAKFFHQRFDIFLEFLPWDVAIIVFVKLLQKHPQIIGGPFDCRRIELVIISIQGC